MRQILRSGMGLGTPSLCAHQALILAATGDPAGRLKVIDDGKARLGGVPADWSPVRGICWGCRINGPRQNNWSASSVRKERCHQLGFIYLGMDEKEKALAEYERSMETDPADVAPSRNTTCDRLPRFEAMKQKLGILRE
jgi:hypothetical protein